MHSVKKNILYNSLLKIIRVLTPVVTIPYVTRILVPDELGLYNFATGYTTLFVLIATLGLSNYGPREISKIRDDKEKTSKLLSELFSISVISSFLISLVFFISIIFIGKFRNDALIFIIAGISLYMRPFQIDWFYGGLEEFKYIALRSIVVNLICIILLFILVRSKEDFILYLLIHVFNNILTYIWNFLTLFKSGYKLRLTFNGLRQHLTPLIILLLSSVAIYVYTALDTLMLGVLASYSIVAFYTYSMHISKGILELITSISGVMLPRISYFAGNGDVLRINSLISKTFSFICFFSIPCAVILAVTSPVFVPLFLGPQYLASIPILQILSFLIVIIGLNNLFAIQCLIGLGYDRSYLYCILSGCILNFLLNLLFIPEWGAIGASFSSIIAETAVLMISVYYVYTKTNIRIKIDKEFLFTVSGTLLLIPLYYLLRYFVDGWALLIVYLTFSTIIYAIWQYKTSNRAMLSIVELFAKRKRNSF